MTQILEQQLFKLRNSLKPDWGWVVAELTPEESRKLSEIIVEGIPTGTYTTGNLGYIDPQKVRRYFIPQVGREYDGPPELEVFIRLPSEQLGDHIIGNYCFIHKEEGEEHYPLHGPILKGDNVDIRYIVDDLSGKFIPITRERIERAVGNAYATIDKGYSNAFYEIKVAEELAKVAGLSFSRELRKLRRYAKETDWRMYSQPDNLRKTIEDLTKAMEFAGFDFLENTGKGELLREFLTRLPRLSIPPELREDVRFIIDSYSKLYEQSAEEVQEQIKKLREDARRDRREKKRLEKLLELLQLS